MKRKTFTQSSTTSLVTITKKGAEGAEYKQRNVHTIKHKERMNTTLSEMHIAKNEKKCLLKTNQATSRNFKLGNFKSTQKQMQNH
jgi:hypothetical protein